MKTTIPTLRNISGLLFTLILIFAAHTSAWAQAIELNEPGNTTAGLRAAYTVTRTGTTNTAPLVVTLSVNKTGGEFFNDPTAGEKITSVTINAGSDAANFWFRSEKADTYTITVTATIGDTKTDTDDITVSPGAATKLMVKTQPVGPGASGTDITEPEINVTDSFGNVVTSLSTGSVTVSIGSGTRGLLGGSLSANISSGVATFTNDLTLIGDATQSYTLRFTSTGLQSVDSDPITVAVRAASKLQILLPGETAAPGNGSGKTGTPDPQTAGTPFTITVNAVDDAWNIVTYPSTPPPTVTLESSDPNATFSSGGVTVTNGILNNTGTRSFSATLKKATPTCTSTPLNCSTITVRDQAAPPPVSNQSEKLAVTPSLDFDKSSGINVNPGAATKLQVLMPGETANPGSLTGKTGTTNAQTAGIAFPVTLRSVDAYWNLVTTSNPVVSISSTTDNYFVPPVNGELSNGVGTFSVIFKRAATCTGGTPDCNRVTATVVSGDTGLSPDTGSGIVVNPANAIKLQILVPGETADPGSPTGKTGTPNTLPVNTNQTIIINAVDQYFNVSSSTAQIALTTNAAIPADVTFTPGSPVTLAAGTVSVTTKFTKAGTYTITATDNASTDALTPITSPSITVKDLFLTPNSITMQPSTVMATVNTTAVVVPNQKGYYITLFYERSGAKQFIKSVLADSMTKRIIIPTINAGTSTIDGGAATFLAIGTYNILAYESATAVTPATAKDLTDAVDPEGGAEFKSASLTVTPIAYGDVDGVGGITPNDAVAILDQNSELITLTTEQNLRAEVNNDGIVGVTDASLILQRSGGTINCFPARDCPPPSKVAQMYAFEGNLNLGSVVVENRSILVPIHIEGVGSVYGYTLTLNSNNKISFKSSTPDWIYSLNESDKGFKISSAGANALNSSLLGYLVLDENTSAIIDVEISASINDISIQTMRTQISFNEIPKEFNLEANYPNPFNPSTNIGFSLPEQSNVVLEVYNVQGQLVSRIDKGALSAGRHTIKFDASNLANGVYLYTLRAGKYQATQKMTLIK